MKKRGYVQWLFLLFLLALTACESGDGFRGTLIPNPDNTYSIVTNSSSRSLALNSAINSAWAFCGQEHKRPIVVGTKERYQGGLDKDLKQLLNNAAGLATLATGYPIFGLSTDEDNRAIVRFSCQP